MIVSHGGAIANFYRKWENYTQVRREGAIPNCSIFKYEYDDGIFVLKEIIRHDFFYYAKIKARGRLRCQYLRR